MNKINTKYNSYKTIETFGEAEIIEKKSRFLGKAFPVSSEDMAMEFLNDVKKKHRDARHNCFAYQLGTNYEEKRLSDDGEPSGTAGLPMLDVLDKGLITNVLIVVTRYFGGTLLGTGGLVRAYGKAAKEAVLNANIIEMFPYSVCKVTCDYSLSGKIQYALLQEECIINDTIYDVNVTFDFLTPIIPVDKLEKIRKIVAEITSGSCDILVENVVFIAN